MNKNTTFLIFILVLSFLLFTRFNFILKNNGYYQVSRTKSVDINSDSAIISGRIFDLKSKTPLSYSSFSIKDFKTGCQVNDSGYFEIKIKRGVYKFSFSCVGNTNLITKQIKVDSNNVYYFNAYLDSYQLY